MRNHYSTNLPRRASRRSGVLQQMLERAASYVRTASFGCGYLSVADRGGWREIETSRFASKQRVYKLGDCRAALGRTAFSRAAFSRAAFSRAGYGRALSRVEFNSAPELIDAMRELKSAVRRSAASSPEQQQHLAQLLRDAAQAVQTK
ncbi:hypothetical protein [Sapientia aquatica]|uniref:Uncharacterized protein n=1 Tax=Sapientia aquatica TaxID=1549640 RepID=A0A4R5VXM0_9BURK|nr:hypothetical protein [Sapientia aquatica]TDK63766.1 hypothetical protein E2I14_14465 [Sapientia aquatica]